MMIGVFLYGVSLFVLFVPVALLMNHFVRKASSAHEAKQAKDGEKKTVALLRAINENMAHRTTKN